MFISFYFYFCLLVLMMCAWFAAIGHTTNLMSRDSNMMIIRGHGNVGPSISSQMLRAADDFLHASGILNDPPVDADGFGAYQG